jgi:hypothetical protein
MDTYGGEDLTSIELSHYEKSETKRPATEVVAAPLSMLPSSTEDPETKLLKTGNDEAASESGSTVLVDSANKSTDKETDDKKTAQIVSATPIGLGASNDPASESQKKKDEEVSDDKKDAKDEDDKDKGDKDKKGENTKDGKAGEDKDEKDGKDDKEGNDSSQPKGPDEAVHEGFKCDECKVRHDLSFRPPQLIIVCCVDFSNRGRSVPLSRVSQLTLFNRIILM